MVTVLVVITMVEVVVVTTIEVVVVVVIMTMYSCCNRNVISTQSLGKHPMLLDVGLGPHNTQVPTITLPSTTSTQQDFT